MQGHTATATATRTAKFPATIGLRSPMAAGMQMVLTRGEELFAEGDEAEYFYKVVSGAIRSYKLLSDGRRQIDAFHLRGDIFGLEAGSEHRFSAEAVGDVQVIAYRRSRLSAIIEQDAVFRDRIMTATLRNLQRAQDHMLLLGRKTAQEKLATFLLDMAERLSGDDEHFDLPMQRSDIADHLGLTIETVSRTLTQFTRSGLIRLPPAGRSISLCNRMALKRLDA
ncbi:helix-turn-helix domain-containing protein [Reyranella soli]|jgi:CRP/FNR family nitrogen fixation transcriptional regulator|uniref:Transcriptional regulator n=1 Tax=Reyranella soli TaxID=1230389 RepID=A0A512N7X8_9HYPH|nr:helix-turn-helix domain-containing protein [Reyranella soli]GEP55087.1 transcriptional regulator [Reyranella soli]